MLVDDWKDAWKWLSVQGAVIASLLALVGQLHPWFPQVAPVVPYTNLAAFIFTAGIPLLRVIKQD